MAGRIVVTKAELEAAQGTLKRATENANQCAQDAKNTVNQLQGAWEGVAASKYVDLLNEITPKMQEAAKVYEEIAQTLKAYVAKMDEADNL